MVSEQTDVAEWTLDGALDELARIHRSMRDRQFAFILGAGASVTSGIPTGDHLAQRWLRDLYQRECVDQQPLDEWIKNCGIGDGTLSLVTAADYYPQIFERRFDGDREAGYAELEEAMEGKSPSLGYSLLAEIIQHTRHKVVVTTNFDNLVADALAMHAHQSPLVVAHESLAGFVRPQLRRPLVAKIHRDLFLHPINDRAGVSTMEQGWKIALKKLFQYFTPIVVGYGGNDGSLMGMLSGLERGDIAGRILWCYREGSPPPNAALAVLAKHKGLLVRISGFDEFMLQLAAKLVTGFDVAAIAERTARLGHERAERYRAQAKTLLTSSAAGSPAEQKVGEVLSGSVRSGSSWWAWELRAQSAADIDDRKRIYLEGLRQFPDSAELTGNYANFLADVCSDYDGAEAKYKKALELDPRDAHHAYNYALFLADERENYDAAETMFQQAIDLAQDNVPYIRGFAHFLAHQREDFPSAKALLQRALELDPRNAEKAAAFAVVLSRDRNGYDATKTMFERAIELDPKDANVAGDFAAFLQYQHRDLDATEAMYKKALELDQSSSRNADNYASFLANCRRDYAGAEALYRRAVELDPKNSNAVAGYTAVLLAKGDRESLESAASKVRDVVSLSRPKVTQTVAEALLYGALLEELAPDAALGDMLPRLKGAFATKFLRGDWDFGPLFDAVLPRLLEDRRSFFVTLGQAILDHDRLGALEDMPIWRETQAIDPFAP